MTETQLRRLQVHVAAEHRRGISADASPAGHRVVMMPAFAGGSPERPSLLSSANGGRHPRVPFPHRQWWTAGLHHLANRVRLPAVKVIRAGVHLKEPTRLTEDTGRPPQTGQH